MTQHRSPLAGHDSQGKYTHIAGNYLQCMSMSAFCMSFKFSSCRNCHGSGYCSTNWSYLDAKMHNRLSYMLTSLCYAAHPPDVLWIWLEPSHHISLMYSSINDVRCTVDLFCCWSAVGQTTVLTPLSCTKGGANRQCPYVDLFSLWFI